MQSRIFEMLGNKKVYTPAALKISIRYRSIDFLTRQNLNYQSCVSIFFYDYGAPASIGTRSALLFFLVEVFITVVVY